MGSIGDVFPTTNLTNGQTNWGPQLVLILDELIDRVSSPVPFSSIEGGLFDLDNNELTNVKDIEFTEQTSAPTTEPGGMYYMNGEWYFVTSSGAIQITDSGSLNITLDGGIGGDYGSGNPAAVIFDDATKYYNFYDNYAGGEWGYVKGLGFDIAASTSSLIKAKLRFTGASNITLDLFSTLPAAGRSVVVVDDNGDIRHNDATNTVENDIILASGVKVQHGSQYLTIPIAGNFSIQKANLGDPTYLGVDNGYVQHDAAGSIIAISSPTALRIPLPIQSTWRVKSVTLYYDHLLANNVTVGVYSQDWNTVTQLAGGSTNVVANATSFNVVCNLNGAPFAAPAGYALYCTIQANAGTFRIYSIAVEYDVPA